MKSSYDVLDNRPIEVIDKINVPCYFMVAEGDKLALPEKVKLLHDGYKGTPKKYVIIGGEHSSIRTDQEIERASEFLQSVWKSIDSYNNERSGFLTRSRLFNIKNSAFKLQKKILGDIFEGKPNQVNKSLTMVPARPMRDQKNRG